MRRHHVGIVYLHLALTTNVEPRSGQGPLRGDLYFEARVSMLCVLHKLFFVNGAAGAESAIFMRPPLAS